MRTKYTIDAEVIKRNGNEWEVVRFEQISTSEKTARRQIIQRCKAAGFWSIGMQKTISMQHCI